MTRTSILDLAELPETAEAVQQSQFKSAVKVVTDIIAASNSKIDEICHEDVEPAAKNQIRDLLLKLNSDIYDNLDVICFEADNRDMNIAELLENTKKLKTKLAKAEEEVRHLHQAYHILSLDCDGLKTE